MQGCADCCLFDLRPGLARGVGHAMFSVMQKMDMAQTNGNRFTRRAMLRAAAAALGATALPAFAQNDGSTEFIALATTQRHNISSFRMLNWQDHFANTQNGAVLVDIISRVLHYWSEDQSVYRLYSTSVPLSEDLTRRGVTSVVDKVVNPTWRPTTAMRERNPGMARNGAGWCAG